jgi:hypothetical protein
MNGKHAKPAEHLVYWACPHGCLKVAIRGEMIRAASPLLDMFGIEIDQRFLEVLPRSWLEDAESAVEHHEQVHLQAVA